MHPKIFLYYSISHNVYSAKILGVWWHSEAIHMLQGSVFRSRLVGFVQTWYNWRPGLKCPHKPGGGTGCPKNVHWKLIDRGDAIERFDTLLTKLPSSEQTQAAARWVMVGDIWGSSGSFKRLWAVRSVSWGTWSVGRFAKRPSKAWNEVWSSFIIVSLYHVSISWAFEPALVGKRLQRYWRFSTSFPAGRERQQMLTLNTPKGLGPECQSLDSTCWMTIDGRYSSW
jgi:hypothetical protein